MIRSTLRKIGGRRGGLALLALTAAAGGVTAIGVALGDQQSAPQPHDSAVSTPGPAPPASPRPGTIAGSDTSTSPEQEQPKPLPPSEPVAISIPAIDVASEVFPIGKSDDGSLAVPQPGPNLNKAAWFENSPTPGQPGPSIIEGHVDTPEGPSVFFNLGDLRPGHEIQVTRADNKTVTFTVTAVQNFPKNEFPTKQIYGGDLTTPTLRLITCSDFDHNTGHHTGNLIAFAHLSS